MKTFAIALLAACTQAISLTSTQGLIEPEWEIEGSPLRIAARQVIEKVETLQPEGSDANGTVDSKEEMKSLGGLIKRYLALYGVEPTEE